MDSTDTKDATAKPAGNADDMLAQLAGDEIDRLLAEAEAENAPAPTPVAPPPPAPLIEETAPAIEPPPAEAVETAPAIVDVEAKEEVATIPADAPAAITPPAPPDAPAEIAATEPAPDAAAAPAQAADHAKESKPPDAPTAAPETPPPAEQPASVLNVIDQDEAAHGQLPWHLRIFDMIISPFEAIPDPVCNALGKVAVVTLVNAVGMILYVIIFRRHHHP